MKFSYLWLKELYPKLGAPPAAAESLTFHSFEVEDIAKKGKDTIFDIAVLANRIADASGHIGIAREFAVIRGDAFRPPEATFTEDAKTKADDLLAVSVKTRIGAPRYSARVIQNIKVGSSPAWMRERLESCGLRPINVVVDITNYVMLETGQPLHAFDYDRLRGGGKKKEIIVRTAKRGETMITINDRVLALADNDVVIADPRGAIGLAGIKGGKGSEIHEGTTRVVLEAANFDRIQIRQTARRVGLRTDASFRFEHGIDPSGTIYALDRAAALLQKLAGGKVAKGVVDVYSGKPRARAILFSLAETEALLGAAIPEAVATSILTHLGCRLMKLGRGKYRVMPPPFRPDLEIEEDLIEEVGRIWGYEKIHPVMPLVRAGIPADDQRRVFENQVMDRLVGFGFTESHLSSFTGEKELALFGLKPAGLYELENPTSPETAYLVNVPAMKYVRSAAENLYHFDTVRIFGITRAFFKTNKGPVERRRLVLVIAEKRKDGKEAASASLASGREFYALKGTIDALLESFGIADHWYDDAAAERQSWAHPGRIAEIKIGDAQIGTIGEISPEIHERLKAKAHIVMATFDIEQLLNQIETEEEFQPISKFPAIVRDIALLIPEDTRLQSVENALFDAATDLLVDADLFDEYEGSDMPDGMKSVSFHLVFQSKERTLIDEEVDQDFKKIVGVVHEKGWEVR